MSQDVSVKLAQDVSVKLAQVVSMQLAKGQTQCDCPLCDLYGFPIPLELLASVLRRQLVIVAGPGIGIEASSFPSSFPQQIAAALGVAKDSLAAPDLMTRFCAQPDGRLRLLSAYLEKRRFALSNPGLAREAVSFHQQLATICQIDTYVTASWDEFFERFCMATPFAWPADMDLIGLPGRKVIKLHGSIGSPASIVATREDHTERYEEWADAMEDLQTALAGKMLAYVGWSPEDPIFAMAHDLLRKAVGPSDAPSYFISHDEIACENIAQRTDFGAIPTDLDSFISSLKNHLSVLDELVEDKVFAQLEEALGGVIKHHLEFSEERDYGKRPTAILTGCYQDGLIDLLNRMRITEHADGQLCPDSIRVEMESYAKQRAAHLERGHYMDVAYIDGFVQGLSLLLSKDDEERKSPPAFYVYGAERQPRDARECRKMLARARALDPAAYDYCVDLVKRYKMEEEDIDLHHGPFLEMGP